MTDSFPKTDKEDWFERNYSDYGQIDRLLDWLYWPSVIQSTIGAILLFLFLLGLRNRFRLK